MFAIQRIDGFDLQVYQSNSSPQSIGPMLSCSSGLVGLEEVGTPRQSMADPQDLASEPFGVGQSLGCRLLGCGEANTRPSVSRMVRSG